MLLLWAPVAPAQERSIPGFDRDGYFSDMYAPTKFDLINEVKADIASLLEENKKLEVEYKRLQDQFRELQGNVEQRHQSMKEQEREGIAIVTPDYDEPVVRKRPRKIRDEQLPGQLDMMENERLMLEGQNSFLTGQHMDLNDKERLLKLQLADLEYEKRELELELKIKEFRHLEGNRKEEWEAQDLRNQLQASIENERELGKIIEESKDNAVTGPRRMPFFRRQNKRLIFQIKEAQKKLDFKVRENTISKDKMLYTSKLMEGPVVRKEEQNAMLEADVEQLEEEYSALNEEVNAALVRQDKKKKLVEKIVDLDQENQRLREKISNLQDQIGSMERGSARRDG